MEETENEYRFKPITLKHDNNPPLFGCGTTNYLIDQNQVLYDTCGNKIKNNTWYAGFSYNLDEEGIKYSKNTILFTQK
jgi:hypothetical protein